MSSPALATTPAPASSVHVGAGGLNIDLLSRAVAWVREQNEITADSSYDEVRHWDQTTWGRGCVRPGEAVTALPGHDAQYLLVDLDPAAEETRTCVAGWIALTDPRVVGGLYTIPALRLSAANQATGRRWGPQPGESVDVTRLLVDGVAGPISVPAHATALLGLGNDTAATHALFYALNDADTIAHEARTLARTHGFVLDL